MRPNYGYDFGGYRDAVLALDDWKISPDRLIILNDSIWFPLDSGENLIRRMEEFDADLVGAVIHLPMRRRKLSTKRHAFLESYFYLVNRSALQSRQFLSFWKGYRVSSNKYNAVYRGERGFSRAMDRSGLRIGGVLNSNLLVETLAVQDDTVLRATLEYAAYTDQDFRDENRVLMGSFGSPDWRTAALSHIKRVVSRRSFHASFPVASVGLLGASFIKKSSGTFLKRSYGTLQTAMRTAYLGAVKSGVLPSPSPEVLVEIEARQAQQAQLDAPMPPASAQPQELAVET